MPKLYSKAEAQMPATLYIDTCALSRLTDDLSQPRIRREAEAMARIVDLASAGKVRWVASTVLRYEIERNPDPIRRLDTLRLLSAAAEVIEPMSETVERAIRFSSEGLSSLDALHLASAQQAQVQWLITTDDRFLARTRQQLQMLHPELINPVDWLERTHLWLLPQSPQSLI